jgi:hypothetical protein
MFFSLFSFVPVIVHGCMGISNICGSEMFLGPAHENFKFEPKHKSNAYEFEAEG